MFERKNVRIRIVAIGAPIKSCLTGKMFTAVGFMDGKTYRSKEFHEDRDNKLYSYFVGLLDTQDWPNMTVEKIGKGKYAGYDFSNAI